MFVLHAQDASPILRKNLKLLQQEAGASCCNYQ
jgi:hypothetical protein